LQLNEEFDANFELLTAHGPFPWQRELFGEFLQKRFPKTRNIPTGLGKTSIIAIWLLALAHHARSRTMTMTDVPRRLVYVVNRRTVVDQATREAEEVREALVTKPELQPVADALRSMALPASDPPLAISTLRGQFADNAEWRNDPARAAVVVGTVDMIGSRLLFSGYGCGFKSRPLHAGFLGQNTLLVHDEAHLEPAFQKLISTIESEQKRCRETQALADLGRFRVMALTATSRSGNEPSHLTDDDRAHPVIRERIEAKKGIAFHPVEAEKSTPDRVAEQALAYEDGGKAILIFLRRLEHVEKVMARLPSRRAQVLTGTLRGLERDALAKEDPVFARFIPKWGDAQVAPASGTVFLVCTSAGEVGVNISADHLVCDLTPFDSMAQRFGRVNRFGGGNAHIDIVHPVRGKTTASIELTARATSTSSTRSNLDFGAPSDASGGDDAGTMAKPLSRFDEACVKTLSVLLQLPPREDGRYDGSPAALGDLPVAARQAAFTPQPETLEATDVLFDAWALTSIRERLPGRPPVADWLHGVAEWEPPETHVAWREEVAWITPELLSRYEPEELLEDYPLKPHELLRDRTIPRVFDHLEAIARRCHELFAWLIEPDGKVRVLPLPTLVERDRYKKPVIDLADSTVLLPPAAGGLENGMLNGSVAFDESQPGRYDVSDQWKDEKENLRRCRVWDDDEPPEGMRLARTIDTRLEAGEESADDEQSPGRRYWFWYVRPRSADDDGSRIARVAQLLDPHLQSAAHFASAIVAKLGLSEPEATAVTLAARWHDLGKNRATWQRSIRNADYPGRVLAKSGSKMWPIDLNGYRHEFGSLIDLSRLPEFLELSADVQDLLQHLIAAHHGRARPHFPADEAFDPERAEDLSGSFAREVPRRFARLQRTYGRWGLAYLESLVRAADAMASQPSYGLAAAAPGSVRQ
jgi:CRISPR-associated endonuclease/helicase Cas3